MGENEQICPSDAPSLQLSMGVVPFCTKIKIKRKNREFHFNKGCLSMSKLYYFYPLGGSTCCVFGLFTDTTTSGKIWMCTAVLLPCCGVYFS